MYLAVYTSSSLQSIGSVLGETGHLDTRHHEICLAQNLEQLDVGWARLLGGRGEVRGWEDDASALCERGRGECGSRDAGEAATESRKVVSQLSVLDLGNGREIHTSDVCDSCPCGV